jgi:two-component system sensor histidine kinase DegS
MADELANGLTDDDRGFLLDILDERTALDNELTELELIVQQNAGELDSASQRYQKSQATYKEYEPRLDSLSRDDLRRLINSVHQAEMRNVIVREQRERLLEKQECFRKLLLVIDYALRIAPFAGLEVPQTAQELAAQTAKRQERQNAAARQAASVASAADAGRQREDGAPTTTDAMTRIIQAQEEERQRLARQMHDGPAQSMTNLILRTELCERLVKSNPSRAATELHDLKELVNNTLQETRQFIFDVRPMILDDLGLVPAIRRYVEDFNQKGGPEVVVKVLGSERRLPSAIEIGLFRVIQDAMKIQESRGHEHGLQMSLQLGTSDVQLVVVYPQAIIPAHATDGKAAMYDFETIEQRVSTIGGKTSLDHLATESTLRVSVPLPRAA